MKGIANIIGIDDAPFERGDVETTVLGAVFCDDRIDGIVTASITVDGSDAGAAIEGMIRNSRFDAHIRCVLIQGVTLAGFNVIDLRDLAQQLDRPVIAVCRQVPDRAAIRTALLEHFPDGRRRWQRIERLEAPVPVGDVQAQWSGCERSRVVATLRRHTRFGHLPEPIRVAHLIAGGIATGHSRGRA